MIETNRKLGELYVLDQLKMTGVVASSVDLSNVATSIVDLSSFC